MFVNTIENYEVSYHHTQKELGNLISIYINTLNKYVP